MSLTDSQLALAGVGVAHHFGGKAYIKETRIPQGARLTQHEHDHDHLSYLVSGWVVLTVDGMPRDVHGPACLLVPAGKTHEVQAITDTLWLCVWGTECTDPEKVDEEVEAGR